MRTRFQTGFDEIIKLLSTNPVYEMLTTEEKKGFWGDSAHDAFYMMFYVMPGNPIQSKFDMQPSSDTSRQYGLCRLLKIPPNLSY